MKTHASDEWTDLIIGHVLPSGENIQSLNDASKHFESVADNFHEIRARLHQGIEMFSEQEGIAAVAGRHAFQRGEQLSGNTADKYEDIQECNDSARSCASGLRHELLILAEDGNSRIRTVQDSEAPLSYKMSQITAIIMELQIQANTKAATCAANILDTIQNTLDKQGIPTSARKFAEENSIHTNKMLGSPNKEAIHQQIQMTLNHVDMQTANHSSGKPPPPTDTLDPALISATSTKIGDSTAPMPSNNEPNFPVSSPEKIGDNPRTAPSGIATVPETTQPKIGDNPRLTTTTTLSTPPPTASPTPTTPNPAPSTSPSTSTPAPVTSTPPAPSAPTGGLPATGMPSSPATAPPTSANLMQSFGQGAQVGTSAGPSAASPAGPMPPSPPGPAASVTPHAAQTAPSGGHAPAVEVPAHLPPADAQPPPVADAGGPYVAGPAASANPATGPAIPSSPLPTYGADIRPPAPATPAAATTPAGPAPAAPSSAPAGPSGTVGQPAIVRQLSTGPTSSPATVTEQAVATTAGSAAAGAVSAETTAQTRLQNLVDAVARQEPRLAWAASDRPDGTTVLVTDLACGWIPPHIDVPVGTQLLDPARRRGTLKPLLGEVTVTATYLPGQHLPPAEVTEPVPTSPRARYGPVVDELGWELNQATKWRDQLPRIAHTLAKAATRETGVLDSEIDSLRAHLTAIGVQALHGYPDVFDSTAVGNWQLLATIAALIGGSRPEANYHLAWFQALSRPTTGGGSDDYRR